MKLLLVEDDRHLTDALQPLLRAAGYAVEIAHDGIEGEFLGNEIEADLIVLDLGLPSRNGLEVLKNWRSSGNKTPVLVLTARDAWHERVEGLKAGADDYLGKPFHTQELLSRIEAICRRHVGQSGNALNWNGITLDTDSQQAFNRNGELLTFNNNCVANG